VEEFGGLFEESLWSVLKTFVVTLWSFSDDFEVIVIVNKTSFWWNWMIAIAVLAEDIYCLYLPSLLYLGLAFCLSCLEFWRISVCVG